MAYLRELKARWQLLRAFLLRYPLGDLILAYEVGGWGFLAFFWPNKVLYQSHFGRLATVVLPLSIIALVTGLYTLWAAFRLNEKHRRRAAFLSLFMLLGLAIAVSSITGKLAWSGHVILALLVVLALVR